MFQAVDFFTQAGNLVFENVVVLYQAIVEDLEILHFILFTHATHMSGMSIPLHTLVLALCFFFFGLCTFPWWEICGWFGEYLTP